jgi:hypothetical protein
MEKKNCWMSLWSGDRDHDKVISRWSRRIDTNFFTARYLARPYLNR